MKNSSAFLNFYSKYLKIYRKVKILFNIIYAKNVICIQTSFLKKMFSRAALICVSISFWYSGISWS